MREVSSDPDRIIQVMPESLANKIAAGEVVQRPASAAKELIENALDAGADDITVVLKEAGSTLIQVIDNGCGMGEEDAVQCFKRHATSKIREIEDLDRLHTLGFRGEALASIAAVAQVELRTKRVQDDAGLLVRVEGGTTTATEPCATPNGTSIAIRNLFYNVPARRNFLKTPATEFKHLVETFQFLALAHPAIAFTLIHDDNEVYRLPRADSKDVHEALRRRIADLFGGGHAEHLVPVEESTSYLSVHGFVSTPEFHRRSRGEQFLFVNGRFVKNRYLDHAVLGAYHKLVPDGAYPFYALFLDLDPRHVDVNVHPTKAEIKFDDERGIYGVLKAVIQKALGMADLTPQIEERGTLARRAESSVQPATAAPARSSFGAMPSPTPHSFSAVRSDAGERRAEIARSAVEREPRPRQPLGDLTGELYGEMFPAEDTQHTLASGSMQEAEELPEDSGEETLLWQLHNRYILTQIRSGLMILDQQAAHERILYEQALQSMESGFGMSQQLLFAQTLEFNPADFELLKELLPDLRSLGFAIDFFSGRSAVVRGVPTDVRPGEESRILDDILQQFKTFRTSLQIKSRDNLARSIAQRSAIQAGTKLSVKEMRKLIDQLFLCEMPYASPHGRPTIIKISIEELDKRFGRNG